MTAAERWAGWVRLGGILMLIIATIDVCQGLIAIIRSEYYVMAPNQIVVFDTTAWGWITLIWGIVVGIAGFGLLAGANWARWFTIIAGSINFIVQLGFVGSTQYPLWALTALALNAIVLYAVIVRWDEASDTIRRMAESRY
jgi:uncharacterized membrane protein (DUF2068 family)